MRKKSEAPLLFAAQREKVREEKEREEDSLVWRTRQSAPPSSEAVQFVKRHSLRLKMVSVAKSASMSDCEEEEVEEEEEESAVDLVETERPNGERGVKCSDEREER